MFNSSLPRRDYPDPKEKIHKKGLRRTRRATPVVQAADGRFVLRCRTVGPAKQSHDLGLLRLCLKCRLAMTIIIFACFVFLSSSALTFDFPGDFVRYSAPDFLTFDELVSLSKDPYPTGSLLSKLEHLWKTPIISNEAYHSGVLPQKRIHPQLGPFLRVATWNIEKSFEIERVIKILNSAESYKQMIDPAKAPPASKQYQNAVLERDLLSEADIFFVQEMDIGVKRSDYVDAARELAKALRMNYAYGATYLELDPAYLGLEKMEFENGQTDQEAVNYYKADPMHYKGLFGIAVLSRYPIKKVEVFPLHNQGYDWYWGEKKKLTFLEKSRRFGSETVFLSKLHREMKIGNRIFMRVDLHVPGLPNDTLTLINIHLEIKCLPKARELQVREILSYIQDIKNPVIMAGDFNSAPSDLSPTSVGRVAKRTAKDPTTWFSIAVNHIAPQALLINATRTVSNVTKNFQNPTAKSIPVIAPNSTAGLFEAIQNYRFKDGHAFDFRGDSERSVNGEKGLLSNSNQRDRFGYKTTFQVRRPLGDIVGKYRLDWVFVKSFLTDPKDSAGSYQFSPHFGRTLEDMNTVVDKQFSDHHPNIVDLPFEEVKQIQ